MKAGQGAEAELSFQRSYELDAANPVTGYNLASLLYLRGELVRAQFYVRRLNNSDLANSESLWLGIKVERKLENREAMQQLTETLPLSSIRDYDSFATASITPATLANLAVWFFVHQQVSIRPGPG